MEKVKLGESSVSSNSSSFTSATTLTETGHTFIPKRYVLPPSQRPDGTLDLCPYTFLPIVDLSLLRPQIIEQVLLACKDLGFFKVLHNFVMDLCCLDLPRNVATGVGYITDLEDSTLT